MRAARGAHGEGEWHAEDADWADGRFGCSNICAASGMSPSRQSLSSSAAATWQSVIWRTGTVVLSCRAIGC